MWFPSATPLYLPRLSVPLLQTDLPSLHLLYPLPLGQYLPLFTPTLCTTPTNRPPLSAPALSSTPRPVPPSILPPLSVPLLQTDLPSLHLLYPLPLGQYLPLFTPTLCTTPTNRPPLSAPALSSTPRPVPPSIYPHSLYHSYKQTSPLCTCSVLNPPASPSLFSPPSLYHSYRLTSSLCRCQLPSDHNHDLSVKVQALSNASS